MTSQSHTMDLACPSESSRDLFLQISHWAHTHFNTLHASSPQKNMIVSSISVYIAMAMLAEGLSSKSRSQLIDLFHFDRENILTEQDYKRLKHVLFDRNDVVLNVANAIFVGYKFQVNQQYVDVLRNKYDSDCLNVDWGSSTDVEKVNDWVKKKTNNLIKSVMAQSDPLLILMLANAIYFKGTWKLTFNKKNTADLEFTLVDKSRIKVPTMSSHKHKSRFIISDQRTVLELEYSGCRASMIIVMPHNSGDVINFEKDDDIFQVLGTRLINCDLQLPKFDIEFSQELKNLFISLGVLNCFIPNDTDFVNITNVPAVYISSILQKAFVKVDEEGTEAAAVTSVKMRTRATVLAPLPKVIIDKPFYFFIVDSAVKVILFSGYLANPLKK